MFNENLTKGLVYENRLQRDGLTCLHIGSNFSGGVLVLSCILPSARLFICRHVSATFSLDGSPFNLILGNFMKMLRENPILVKIEKNVGKMREDKYISIINTICFIIGLPTAFPPDFPQ